MYLDQEEDRKRRNGHVQGSYFVLRLLAEMVVRYDQACRCAMSLLWMYARLTTLVQDIRPNYEL